MSDDIHLERLLEAFTEPIVYCGTDHVIRYMNGAARERYAGRPAAVGRSIFDCHNNASNATIRDVCGRLGRGEDEVLISTDDRKRAFMRAVRDAGGALLGYYERYEPTGA